MRYGTWESGCLLRLMLQEDTETLHGGVTSFTFIRSEAGALGLDV